MEYVDLDNGEKVTTLEKKLFLEELGKVKIDQTIINKFIKEGCKKQESFDKIAR
ncbi:hypothetical protein [Flavobacterium sp. NKUCC04_CG]|uniref:hypothetical protein n=1 Tax=Flavobacterium sp. NKUCC04_CG TaxID=2842121 RepID=UPI001C5BE0D5|nr:hypothetical protein [Flavobacterium sp. NKUCC04_CG]MBW3520011.1 hypothetical protein [Flavobacterium sp. NKUCC04_CG]